MELGIDDPIKDVSTSLSPTGGVDQLSEVCIFMSFTDHNPPGIPKEVKNPKQS